MGNDKIDKYIVYYNGKELNRYPKTFTGAHNAVVDSLKYPYDGKKQFDHNQKYKASVRNNNGIVKDQKGKYKETIGKWSVVRRYAEKLQPGDTLYLEGLEGQGAFLIKIESNEQNLMILNKKMDNEIESSDKFVKVEDRAMKNLNIILYGPPGTGKTYYVINKAIEIIDNHVPEDRNKIIERYKTLSGNGQIQFITFHQSYSYEEFVEGIKAVTTEEGNVYYNVQDGIFKIISDAARIKISNKKTYDFDESKIQFHKISLGNILKEEDDDIYNYCIDNSVISIGWGGNIDYSKCKDKIEIEELYKQNKPGESLFGIEAVHRFKNIIKNDDIVFVSSGNYKFKAIGKVIGDYYFNNRAEIRYSHYRKVDWLYFEDEIPVTMVLKDKILSQQTVYKFSEKFINIENIHNLIGSSNNNKQNMKYILIIDEINRGNISKIFGEIITLIEYDKRLNAKNELTVTLPYSKKKFGIPDNLYIIGTMNTADRSIALLDTALRRRFSFHEIMPDPNVLRGKNIEGVNLESLLKQINERIVYLYDRDHTIGHAYFIGIESFDDLQNVFKNKIIPLLQEYFYNDWGKIRLVLNDHRKESMHQFVVDYYSNSLDENSIIKGLFGNNSGLEDQEEKRIYRINESAFGHIDAYKKIYES